MTIPGISAIVQDLVLGILLFLVIMATVYITRRFSNVWVNRKIIHLSSVPAILAYMYVFHEPYVFFSFAILFSIALTVPHIQNREYSWFQIKNNFGEIFYCLSFAILSILFWNISKILAGVAMLFTAIGDSVTGLVRSRFMRERGKHWTGIFAMFISCSLIGLVFLGALGVLLSVIATLAEVQPWIDDNLSIPFSTALLGLLFLNVPVL